MVVWLKPCESRSSPGFTPKTPLLTQRGFSLTAASGGANHGWRLPIAEGSAVDPRHAWMLPARNQGANQGWPLHTAGQGWHPPRAQRTKKTAPRGAPLCAQRCSVEHGPTYLAGALSFIIASRAALNGLPSYQFGQRSPPASSLPTPYISCRSSTVPSSFQVAASNSSFGPW